MPRERELALHLGHEPRRRLRRRDVTTSSLAVETFHFQQPFLARRAVDDEAEGRDGMARAAFLAGVSFSVSSVTLIHGMSRPLGARFHLAHCRSNAVLMAAVTAYSLEGARERYAQCSEALGLAGDLPTALAKLASPWACRRSATLY